MSSTSTTSATALAAPAAGSPSDDVVEALPSVALLTLDDRYAGASLLEAFLRGRGHEVSTCRDPLALRGALMREGQPIVVLVPEAGDDPSASCRWLRRLPEAARSRLIVLVEPAGFRAALESGADDVAPWPLDPVALEARLLVAEASLGRMPASPLDADDAAVLVSAARQGGTELLVEADRDGRIRSCNRAVSAAIGRPESEIVGRDLVETIAPVADEAVRSWVRAACRAEAAAAARASVECAVTPPGGTERQIVWRVVPALDGARRVGAVALGLDVTERNQMHARLMLSDRLVSIGTLAAGVAHEINNPLAYVTANLRFIANEIGDLGSRIPDERRRELGDAINDAQQGADRVRTIVRELKGFSRGDDEVRGPVDVRRVLESSINMAWNEIRHRARLVKDLEEVPEVEGNEARLGQVFLNLIINAAQSIPVGAADRNRIRLVTRRDGGRVVVEVHDTGCGIPPENLTRLFEPFYTTKPIGIGTGLGLSISNNIVTRLGGEIRVESAVGKGTVFRVALPIAASALPVEVPATPAPEIARRARILVVDDEPMILASVRRLIGGEHDIVLEGSARDALARLQGGEQFDIIFSDLMMPEMSGMELHAAVSSSDPATAARMVFLSGGAFEPEAQTFLEEHPHLDKPFDRQGLRALIRDLLQ